MAKGGWAKFPHADPAYVYAGDGLKKHWARLHRGDCEPYPADASAQEAWRAYHAGDFEKAVKLGAGAEGSALNAANKAACVYATYLEPVESRKLALFKEVAERCEAEISRHPKNTNAHYIHAMALGRHAQAMSIAKALKEGIGTKVKASIQQTLKLEPKHADAHVAFGTYQAEIIDKVGAMVAGLTYGAKKDAAVECFEKALKLNPESAITRMEYANALVMLHGKAEMKRAEQLYADAAKCKPVDAMERLDVEAAKENLE
jgi:tetratricopeptide (TPR) repeat protein